MNMIKVLVAYGVVIVTVSVLLIAWAIYCREDADDRQTSGDLRTPRPFRPGRPSAITRHDAAWIAACRQAPHSSVPVDLHPVAPVDDGDEVSALERMMRGPDTAA